MQHQLRNTLLTAAVAAACGAAYAQDGVRIYGVVDSAIEVYNNGDTSGARLSSGLREGSRFGFTGTEDLGGGLEAFFKIESTIYSDTGGLKSSGTLFDREANVGLRGNFGSLGLGLQYTPHFLTMAMTDPMGLTIGSAANYFACPLYEGTVNGYVEDETTRAKNSISYESPEFAGFSVQLFAALGEQTKEGSNSPTRGNLYNIGFRYHNGGLMVMGSYLHQNTSVSEYNSWDNYWALGVSYDFEVVKPSLLIVYRDGDDQASGANVATRGVKSPDLTMVQLGASAPLMGGTLLATAGYLHNDSIDEGDAWALGARYDYPLSKRVTLYGGLTALFNEDNANYTISGGGSASPGFDVQYGDDPWVAFMGLTYMF